MTVPNKTISLSNGCKRLRGKKPLNRAVDVSGVTTIPCGACGRSFTAQCGRDAMIVLIKHLRENRADTKHRAEYDWIKDELLRTARNAN